MLFRRLAVFAGGFDLDAAEEVCADGELDRWGVLEVLVSLVDRSLVVADEDGDVTRYRMLESILQYAVELLVSSGEHETLRDRHLERYEAFAIRTEPEFWTDQQGSVTALNRELDNLRAAMDWSLHGGRTGTGCPVVRGIARVHLHQPEPLRRRSGGRWRSASRCFPTGPRRECSS